jgi:hypothetical protein
MRRVKFAMPVAIGLAVLSGPAKAQAQSSTTILGVPVPDRVAGLPHASPFDFETKNPGYGYGITFLSPTPGWKIDVYIYDLRMKPISDDPKSETVQKGFAEAKNEIAELARRGQYTDLTTKDEFTMEDAAGHPRFVCAAYTYYQRARAIELDSYLCFAGAKNEFLSIRMDRPKDPSSETESRRFVKGWIDVLWPSHRS